MEAAVSDERSWVQCDRCQQWRNLPGCTKEEYEEVQAMKRWTCSMNRWDALRASCSQPEEIIVDTAPTTLDGYLVYAGEGRGVVGKRPNGRPLIKGATRRGRGGRIATGRGSRVGFTDHLQHSSVQHQWDGKSIDEIERRPRQQRGSRSSTVSRDKSSGPLRLIAKMNDDDVQTGSQNHLVSDNGERIDDQDIGDGNNTEKVLSTEKDISGNDQKNESDEEPDDDDESSPSPPGAPNAMPRLRPRRPKEEQQQQQDYPRPISDGRRRRGRDSLTAKGIRRGSRQRSYEQGDSSRSMAPDQFMTYNGESVIKESISDTSGDDHNEIEGGHLKQRMPRKRRPPQTISGSSDPLIEFSVKRLKLENQNHPVPGLPPSAIPPHTRGFDGMPFRVPPPTQQTIHWVQCDLCQKWRSLPKCSAEEYAELNASEASWTCSQNKWDLERNSCDAPEEVQPLPDASSGTGSDIASFDAALTHGLAGLYHRLLLSEKLKQSKISNEINRYLTMKVEDSLDVEKDFPLNGCPWHEFPIVVLKHLYSLISCSSSISNAQNKKDQCRHQTELKDAWDFTRILLVNFLICETPLFLDSITSFASCCSKALTQLLDNPLVFQKWMGERRSRHPSTEISDTSGVLSVLGALIDSSAVSSSADKETTELCINNDECKKEGRNETQQEIKQFEADYCSDLFNNVRNLKNKKRDSWSFFDVASVLKFLDLLEDFRISSHHSNFTSSVPFSESLIPEFSINSTATPLRSPTPLNLPVTLFRLSPPVLSNHPLAGRSSLSGGNNVTQIFVSETLPRVVTIHPSTPASKPTRQPLSSFTYLPTSSSSKSMSSCSAATSTAQLLISNMSTDSGVKDSLHKLNWIPKTLRSQQSVILHAFSTPAVSPDSYLVDLPSKYPWPGLEELSVDSDTEESSICSSDTDDQTGEVKRKNEVRTRDEERRNEEIKLRSQLLDITQQLLGEENRHNDVINIWDMNKETIHKIYSKWIRHHQGDINGIETASVSSPTTGHQTRRTNKRSEEKKRPVRVSPLHQQSSPIIRRSKINRFGISSEQIGHRTTAQSPRQVESTHVDNTPLSYIAIVPNSNGLKSLHPINSISAGAGRLYKTEVPDWTLQTGLSLINGKFLRKSRNLSTPINEEKKDQSNRIKELISLESEHRQRIKNEIKNEIEEIDENSWNESLTRITDINQLLNNKEFQFTELLIHSLSPSMNEFLNRTALSFKFMHAALFTDALESENVPNYDDPNPDVPYHHVPNLYHETIFNRGLSVIK